MRVKLLALVHGESETQQCSSRIDDFVTTEGSCQSKRIVLVNKNKVARAGQDFEIFMRRFATKFPSYDCCFIDLPKEQYKDFGAVWKC